MSAAVVPQNAFSGVPATTVGDVRADAAVSGALQAVVPDGRVQGNDRSAGVAGLLEDELFRVPIEQFCAGSFLTVEYSAHRSSLLSSGWRHRSAADSSPFAEGALAIGPPAALPKINIPATA